MEKALILQIGRFDRNLEENVNFEIEGKRYAYPLSSFALKDHLQEKGKIAKVHLLFPVSLYLNKIAISDLKNKAEYQELAEKLEALFSDSNERNRFFTNPAEYYALHPHRKYFDSFSVIHSVGTYDHITFDTEFSSLVFELFLILVNQYLNEPFNELYLDISTGQNIYVTALLEAGRFFLVFNNLQNFLRNSPVDAYIVSSDPILGRISPEQVFKIYPNYPFKVKAFFSAPLEPEKTSLEYPRAFSQLSKNIANLYASGDRKFKQKLNEMLSKAYFFYSALKNNTPLMLYLDAYHNPDEIKSFINTLVQLFNEQICKNYLNLIISEVDKLRNILLMLALYRGISILLSFKNISPKDEIAVSELENLFASDEDSLYYYFGLFTHRPYLSSEIKNNFKKENIVSKFKDTFTLLREYISGEGQDKDIDNRNFLAHCGFERNCVEVKKINDEIYLRYTSDKEKRKKIIEILLEN